MRKPNKKKLHLHSKVFSVVFTIICLVSFLRCDAQQPSKISPAVNEIASLNNCNRYIFSINTLDTVACAGFCNRNNIQILKTTNKYTRDVYTDVQTILLFATQPFVEFIDRKLAAKEEVIIIGYEKRFNSINKVIAAMPAVNGKGITAGVKEKQFNEEDIDLVKRSVPSTLKSNNLDAHATGIATLIAGAGNSYHTGRGMAFKAKLFSSSLSNLFPDDIQALQQANVTVQNHSYGTLIQNFYGAEAKAYDEQLWQNKNLVHVFSGGNQGLGTPASGTYAGISGFANLTGNFKMAKNVITVGAIDTSGNVASFSSKGPLFDGRLAPQITALGPNGTSDAAAIVSSTIALLQQVYKDSNNQALPPASLIKALLFNNADKNNLPVISYNSGYGLVDARKAILALQQKHYDGGLVGNNEVWTKPISIPGNIATITVTLNYTDTAQNINSSKALINDLDIELVQNSTGQVYLPWVLSSAANMDSLQKQPARKRDTLNSTEQISVSLPTAGSYSIRVKGSTIQTIQKQNFNIAYTLDTLYSFEFTNPVNADDINTSENNVLTIQWKTNLPDTSQLAQLFVRYDNNNWIAVQNNIKLHLRKFAWLIPQFEGMLQFRMVTGYGIFESEQVMLHQPTALQVLYNCSDSAKILWRKHAYAQTYSIYTLSDSAYLKLTATTTDTVYTIYKNVNTGEYFAVQPILSNGLHATRSAAININMQGVNCFYNQLLSQNLGTNVLLHLQLPYPQAVEQVTFQKLGANNSVIRDIGQAITVNNLADLYITDTDFSRGPNYYRARLLLKNSQVVYSNIVVEIGNGNSALLVYPNPVKKESGLIYKQRDVHEKAMLLIYDSKGALIMKTSIGVAGTINVRSFNSGIYYYHFTKQNGEIIENGKLIIQ